MQPQPKQGCLSRDRRGGCRARGLWECVHPLRGDAKEKSGVFNPWLPCPLHSKRVSLNLFDYTAFTIHSYYICLALLYRWRLIVCSYFNLINNITISVSGVATNFFIGVNESEI